MLPDRGVSGQCSTSDRGEYFPISNCIEVTLHITFENTCNPVVEW